VNTNIWAGSFPGTTNQWIRFNNNRIKFLSPVPAGYYGVFIDESTFIASNPNAGQRTFGGVEVIGNKFALPDDQPYSSVNFDLIYVAPKTNVLWANIIVRDNDLPFGGIGIESNGGRVVVENNRITRNTQPVAAIRVIRSTYGQFAATTSIVRDNVITDALRGGILHYRLVGDADISRNTITDHGRAGTAYAIDVGADAPYTTNLVALLFRDNLTTINSGSIPGFNIEAPSAQVQFERNREVGVAAGGNRSWASAVVVPWSQISAGATNVPASIGSLPTASLPSPAGQAITYDSTLAAPLLWDGSEWQRLRRYTETNFANLRATNTITATDITARSISLPAYFPTAPFASDANPIYLFLSTNTPLTVAIQNNSTNSGAQAKVSYTAGGNTAEVSLRSPYDSTSTLAGRLYIDGGGTGIVFDIDGSDSMLGTYGNGNQFWLWTTNLLQLQTSVLQADAGITLGGTYRTNWPTYGGGGMTMPNTNGLAIVVSTNELASRHLVGSAQIAVADGDGQSGNPTISITDGTITTNKVDATFHALLGGSSGSSTNLDNLTVTNATRLLSTLEVLTSSNNIVKLSRLGMGAGQSNWVIATGSATNLFIAPASDDWNSWVGMELRRKAGTPHELERVVIPGPLNVTDEAYGAGWDGITEVPTKNAIYDKIESLGAAGQPPSANLTNFTLATHPAANGKVLYSTNTPSGGFFWGDAPTGGSGANSGNRVTGTIGSLDGITNFTFSVNPGTPLEIAVNGTSPSATVDFTMNSTPLLVNGTAALWSAPWNLNSTTPTIADYGYTNATISVSGTNATVVIPMRITMIVTNASSGVFTNPPWGRTIRGYLWGPGGGGGSGRKGLTNTVRTGGGGGGSGGYTEFVIPFLVGGETYAWTNRAGAIGGVGQSANSSNGGNGGGYLTNDVRFGVYRATGGEGGYGGSSSGGTAGAGGTAGYPGLNGGSSQSSGGGGVAGGSTPIAGGASVAPGGGGGGGGINVSDSLAISGAGGVGSRQTYLTTGGTASGGQGGTSFGSGVITSGGGGGGGNALGTGTAGTGGAGGAGGFPGGGGGGGAPGTDNTGVTGNNSGAGGNGGDGAIIIIVE
jgi:hypothetical protein